MRLLALDLSTHVGWALFASRSAAPVLDTWHAPRSSDLDRYGPTFAAFEDWLCAQLLNLKPDVLAFEAPILPRNRTFQKQRAIRISYGLAEIVERIAYQDNVRCIECHAMTVKKRLAGHGLARKVHMIAAATRLGFEVATEHEADAIGVALVAFDFIDPPQTELALP